MIAFAVISTMIGGSMGTFLEGVSFAVLGGFIGKAIKDKNKKR